MRRNFLFALFLFFFFILFCSAEPSHEDPIAGNSSVFNGKLFQGSDGRLEAYMVPPYPANHASFVEHFRGGYCVAWFSGTSEGENLTSIVVSILKDDADQFSTPQVISQRVGYSNQNPVVYYNPVNDIIHLFHSQQPAEGGSKYIPEGEGAEEYATVWELQSTDHAIRWTVPREVFSTPGSFDRNRMVTLDDDKTWYFPMYSAHGSDKDEYSFISYSMDFGETWNHTNFPNSDSLVQPSIIRVSNDPTTTDFRVFFRDRNSQNIYTAYSSDNGHTWTNPEKTVLPNNNAAIEAFLLLSGRIAIVFNNSTKERIPLCVALSDDGGNTWPYSRALEPEAGSPPPSSSIEFSYPSILQTGDENIHITYTFNRDTIKYVQVTEEWIMSSKSCVA